MAKEATVIIFDVGKNSNIVTENEKESFYAKGKLCIQKILQRKIFGKPKDEVGLILMGTNNTSNNLNRTIGGYDYITEKFDLGVTNWGMLRVIEQELRPDNKVADWLDALIVAMNFLKTASDARKYTSLQIVLLTTFSTFVNGESVDYVIKGLQNMKIELVVISNNVNQLEDDNANTGIFSQCISKSQEQNNSEKLIEKIIEKTDGVLCNFEYAIVNLMYFPKKKIKALPWNCCLTIGSDIKINTSTYVMITDDKSLPSWKTESALPNTSAKTVTEYFLNEKKINVEMDTLIKGYMYGTSVIACSEDVDIKLKTVDKCLTCLGFTNENLIRDEYISGTGSHVILPQKDCATSAKVLASLVDAMLKLNTVMIVRKVYRSGTAPKLNLLVPTYRNNYPCFTSVELNFSENLIFFNFPSLRNTKYDPTQEQLDAMDKLIDSMDLMNANEEDGVFRDEAFAYKKTLNPSNQYIYRCIAHRSLKPKQPLPAPDQELLDLLEIPTKIKEQSKDQMEKIAELFQLEEIQKPEFKYKFKINLKDNNSKTTGGEGEKLFNENVDILSDRRNVIDIGTVTPAEDFAFLLNRGEKFSTLCAQLQTIISDLVFKSMTIQTDKIGGCLLLYREEAKLLGAFHYNDWIVEFKKTILNRGKLDFWESVIVKERLGLISAKESESTTKSDSDVEEFYTLAVGSGTNVQDKSDNNEENADDLFDM